VQFARSDWYQGVAGHHFHLLVANPPYIDSADPHLQRGDVRFEPPAALVAADAGLADLARLAAGAPVHLHPGGWLLLEHGSSQGEAVRGLLRDAGFGQVATRSDLAGLERITGGLYRGE
jgi:release factor glutamine methyltransferase